MVLDDAGSNALEAGHGDVNGSNGSMMQATGNMVLDDAGSNALEAGHGDANSSMMQAADSKKNEMAMHITEKHAALGFPCNLCGKILLSKLGCKVHIESEHIGKIFSCPHCEYSYKYKLNVKIHSNRHLGHQYGKWVQALKCGLVFSCPLCE